MRGSVKQCIWYHIFNERTGVVYVKLLKTVLIAFLAIQFCGAQTSKPLKLLIKIATRSRPQSFFNFLDLYYKNLSGKNPYQFIISCDTDDTSMNNNEVRAKFATYPNLSVYYGTSRNKIHACNRDIDKCRDFDIVLLSSDDMKPVLKDFDQVIIDKMLEKFPDTDGVLNFFDGSANQAVNTYPILGRKYYDRFGYVYHPHYTSLWCDNESADVSHMLGKEAVYPDIVVLLHCHYQNGGVAATDRLKCDALYARNDALDGIDRILFVERKYLNFNIHREKRTYIRLSVLLPTYKKYETWLNKTVRELTQQVDKAHLQDSVEIVPLVLESDSQNLAMAMNKLLSISCGEYVCFIEAEEQPLQHYVSQIYQSLADDPDCVSLCGKFLGNTAHKQFVSSVNHRTLQNDSVTSLLPFCYFNPVRHDIALQALFDETKPQPEKLWAMYVTKTGQLIREACIAEPILKLPRDSRLLNLQQ